MHRRLSPRKGERALCRRGRGRRMARRNDEWQKHGKAWSFGAGWQVARCTPSWLRKVDTLRSLRAVAWLLGPRACCAPPSRLIGGIRNLLRDAKRGRGGCSGTNPIGYEDHRPLRCLHLGPQGPSPGVPLTPPLRTRWTALRSMPRRGIDSCVQHHVDRFICTTWSSKGSPLPRDLRPSSPRRRPACGEAPANSALECCNSLSIVQSLTI